MDRQIKKLYKSNKNKMIAGVCGGLAEYMNIDPTIIRLLFVLVSLLWGFGLLAYILAAIIMPNNPDESSSEDDVENLKSVNIDPAESKSSKKSRKAPHTDDEFDDFFTK